MALTRRGSPLRAAALIGIAAALIAAPWPVAGHHRRAPSGVPQSGTADLASVLGADGTFRGAPAIVGAVDTGAWTLVSNLAAGEPPRFSPVVAAAATPVGPWSGLGSNGAGNGALSGLAVDALAVSGTNLYVGGKFTNAAGIATADYIAKWNGSSWSALGSNGAGNGALNSTVRALTVSGTDLYVGGDFTNAAGIATADYIAKWNGSSWSALGSNGANDGAISDLVLTLAASGTNLYAGGLFTNAAGIGAADHIAKWNGTGWSALGSNGAGDGAINYWTCGPSELCQPNVRALAVSGADLYVGGDVGDVAGIPTADYVVKWNGVAWSALGSNGAGDGAITDQVDALAVAGSSLYVGGVFTNAAGIASADELAKWNGSAWSALGSNGAGDGALSGGEVEAIAVSGTDVYAGGWFLNAAGAGPADYVAKWNGSAWSALGSNGAGDGAISNLVVHQGVAALAVSPSDLYVGGDFLNAAGIAAADFVARWSLGPFTDISASPFAGDILWLYDSGITSGCTATTYCPNASVTRGQMAAFLDRALNLPATSTDYFTDDATSIFEGDINRLAAAGITKGCSLTAFCPTANVTRGQMAAFLVRAFGLPATSTDYFTDDNGTLFEGDINALAASGITKGCSPTTFCQTANVTRGEMAAFLHRALG